MNPNIKYNKNRFVPVEIFPSTANCGRYSIIQSFDVIMRICKYFNKIKRDGKYQRFITQNCESSSKILSLMILLEGKYQ
jgi:hypothetical protein